MQVLAIDTETYYDKDYSLSKMTTESYINDPRFEVIMLCIRWPDERYEIVTGTHEEIQYRLDAIEWENYAVLAHNAMFDAAILSWKFGVKPKAWLDTLSMSRAMFGGKGNSLAALAKRYKLEDKMDTAHNMMGRRRTSLSKAEFEEYAAYCIHDTDLCYQLWDLMSQGWYDPANVDFRGPYPIEELRLIDRIIRMYTEPSLVLNKDRLKAHYDSVVARKGELLERSGIDKADLMSNPKFAEVLTSLGVTPPMKISHATGKETYAFAKTDPAMSYLLEHPDDRVQAVVAARLGVKSTLEETRTLTLMGIAERMGKLPVPLRYSAARTHRLGGSDNINLQNLPARGEQAGKIKSCIEAPPGYVMIDCDSSNIEARMLAWLAGQDDLVEDFLNNVDVYCKLASRIFNRPITKADTMERFVGKTVTLGCGYQTGAKKLQATLKAAKLSVEMSLDDCERIIETYRDTNDKIRDLWYEGEGCIEAMHKNQSRWFGREGVVLIEGRKGVKLPSGLYISYPYLEKVIQANGKPGWEYAGDRGTTNIYGGKLTENVVQALARIIVMQQLLRISKKLKVVITVHDAVGALAREEEAEQARAYVEECMRWVPKWADGCPINCESGIGKSYGDC